MIALTRRQNEVLSFLREFQRRDGRMPTGPEIALHFGFRDPSPAYQHLDALEAKGYVTIKRYGYGRPRSIILTKPEPSPAPILCDICARTLEATKRPGTT